MWKNYIKIAWRSLLKNRLYSFVNLIGLTVGLVSCILIGAYIANEWSYDRFQRKGDRIARIVMEFSIGGTGEKVAVCGTKAGPQFRRTFPAVEDFVRMMELPAIVSYNGTVYDEKRFLYADSSFFRLFSFRLLRGDPFRS